MRGQAQVRIIGIDPGLRRTGWGVIETDGVRLTYVSSGLITSTSDEDLAYRLRELFEGLSSVIAASGATEAAVEETFVNVNPRSTLLLGQARGVALATLAAAQLRVAEFAARKVKQSVVGTGTADKSQVAFMVRRLLPKAGEVAADAADALAVAICAAHHRPPVVRPDNQQRLKA